MFSKKTVGKIFGVFFIIMGYLLFNNSLISHGNIFIFVIEIWLSYFLTYVGAGLLLNKILEKNKLASFIYIKVLSIPAIGFIYFHYISAPILTIFIFLGIYFIPSAWFLSIKDMHPVLVQYSQGIVYILSLLSVLFFAYKSNIIMKFIIYTFETRLFKEPLNKYSNTVFTRIYTYCFMIVIYICYNFLTFSNTNLSLIPTEILNVIKEVLVTFVAIDSLVHVYLSKVKKSKTIIE